MKKYLSTAGAAALASALAFAGAANASITVFASTGQTVPVSFVADSPVDGGGDASTSSSQPTSFTIQFGPLAGTTVAAAMTLDFSIQSAGPSDHNWINTQATPLGTYHYIDNSHVLHTGVTLASIPNSFRNNAHKFGVDYSYANSGVNAIVSIADFAITYTGATTDYTVGGHQYRITTGENLLSGSGLYGSLQGSATANGVTLSFGNTNPVPGSQFSSNLFGFTGATNESVSLTDSSHHVVVANGGTVIDPNFYIATQTWAFNGNFAADPAPTTNMVPEPASWGLMLVGFGIVGGVARRRKMLAAA